jgi:hypothetical protein
MEFLLVYGMKDGSIFFLNGYASFSELRSELPEVNYTLEKRNSVVIVKSLV